MGVDGFRRHDARMAEPTEIMERDVPKAIEFEELRELLGDPARINAPTILAEIDIAIPVPRFVFFLVEEFRVIAINFC
jgi:hypothetical protein